MHILLLHFVQQGARAALESGDDKVAPPVAHFPLRVRRAVVRRGVVEGDGPELDYSLTTDPNTGKPIKQGTKLVMTLNSELNTQKAQLAGEFLAPRAFESVYGGGASGGGTSGGGTSGAWEEEDAGGGCASEKKKSRFEGDGTAARDSAGNAET